MKVEKGAIVEALQDNKVICWSDLLERLGLIPFFEAYKNEKGVAYDVRKIFLGKTMIEWVDSILQARIVKSKDKRVKNLKEKYRLHAYGMDALNSCPCTAKDDIDYMELRGL